MDKKIKLLNRVLLILVSSTSMAVQVNPKGLGEVLIYPYYTVNNNLNTLYSVVNTTPDTKALKVRFLEGDIGLEVLSFNIYLSPYDVWTGALVPAVSTQAEHVGEPSVLHYTSDNSCSPFLIKAGQEFLPFVIDTDLDVDNRSLIRATEGHMELIELATFNGPTTAAALHSIRFGVPGNCAIIQADWSDNGVYDINDEAPPTGGIFGSATLVNVAEGMAFPYDAIALQNFWQDAGQHTEPGSLTPNLSDAFPESRVLLANGELAVSEWSTGFEAVSAVLMNKYVNNEYALDTIINGKSEWVVTFPTKKFHTEPGLSITAPFSRNWNGQSSCDDFSVEFYDREGLGDYAVNIVGCSDVARCPKICYSSNVIEFLRPGMPISESTQILGANNQMSFMLSPLGTFAVNESGWARLSFQRHYHRINPVSGAGYLGLPVTGFAVQQYTNAGAAEGLLAQYGSLFMHKGQVEID